MSTSAPPAPPIPKRRQVVRLAFVVPGAKPEDDPVVYTVSGRPRPNRGDDMATLYIELREKVRKGGHRFDPKKVEVSAA